MVRLKPSLARIASRSGQATMEAVLLMIVAMSISFAVLNSMRSNSVMQSMVEGPWSPLRGMIENGVWRKHTIAPRFHPSQFSRVQSREGERQ